MQASAFVLFPDLKAACDAVLPLKQHKVAVAVELHDWASLRCGGWWWGWGEVYMGRQAEGEGGCVHVHGSKSGAVHRVRG